MQRFRLYVWGGEGGQGTLEDILMPVLRASEPELTAAAEQCIETLFDWETDHGDEARSIAEQAKKHKAAITLAGQREIPGASMNVIVGQTKQLLQDDVLAADTRVAAFTRHLESFIGVQVQMLSTTGNRERAGTSEKIQPQINANERKSIR
ncbi:MAG: hypothetical protein, partial [Olavius algarvensis Gamma 1 endosymbiont]